MLRYSLRVKVGRSPVVPSDCNKGVSIMEAILVAACAALSLAFAVPGGAQELPFTYGDY
jgi:hypothetical protein